MKLKLKTITVIKRNHTVESAKLNRDALTVYNRNESRRARGMTPLAAEAIIGKAKAMKESKVRTKMETERKSVSEPSHVVMRPYVAPAIIHTPLSALSSK